MDPNKDPDSSKEPPRMSISQTLVLIPRKQKPLLVKALQMTIDKLHAVKQGLHEHFSVDVEQLDAAAVLDQYHIYWYPQDNITDAVEYLSTHKDKFDELCV
jgi:hypothetical protein